MILACLLLITATAWAYLLYLDRQMAGPMSGPMSGMTGMMAEMGMAMVMPWKAFDAVFAFAMWAVMMVGMMTPSAAPLLLMFARARARQPRKLGDVFLFGAGYLAIWAGFSAVAALAQWGLHRAAIPSSGMTAVSPRLAGAILIGAGAYQWTRLKGSCLTHCRSPLGFLMTHWRDGSLGALSMGWHHGFYCLGCCWALMCVLFVTGVMSLVWVAALTVFVFLEKIGPAGAWVARAGGAVMIGAGGVLLVR